MGRQGALRSTWNEAFVFVIVCCLGVCDLHMSSSNTVSYFTPETAEATNFQ